MNNFQKKVNFIFSIADALRGPYKPNQYGKVILPLTVLRRLDCVLEKSKEKVLSDPNHIAKNLAHYTKSFSTPLARNRGRHCWAGERYCPDAEGGGGMKNNRRSIRLKDYDYSQNGAYFVTICTQNRECLFGNIVNGNLTRKIQP